MKTSDALVVFKTKTRIADLLGISKAAVSRWSDVIPEKNAYRLQELTKGKLKIDRTLYRNNQGANP